MKRILYFAVALAVALGTASCKQDLGQNPPFDYPQEENPGGEEPGGEEPGGEEPLPLPEHCILRMNFDEQLGVEGPYGLTAEFYGAGESYTEGRHGMAYQGAEEQAVLIRTLPDEMKSLGSFTLTMWIRFDGSNKNACNLFAIGHPTLSVANLAFFLNNGSDNGESFFFKGYFNGTAEQWFDKGADATVASGIKNRWTQVGFVYDAATSTASLYHDGTLMVSNSYTGYGPLAFDEVSGIVIGAFPSMVGLSSATGDTEWPYTSSWYTGAMDDLYLYDTALDASQMAEQYQTQL